VHDGNSSAAFAHPTARESGSGVEFLTRYYRGG
jgi:hypothetical protein